MDEAEGNYRTNRRLSSPIPCKQDWPPKTNMISLRKTLINFYYARLDFANDFNRDNQILTPGIIFDSTSFIISHEISFATNAKVIN
ncbi:hypothetical protein PUN28_008116 [Cardiocondyla obscurior]|uniref:Uncharacterized protein n=1 Tax=Cardiocondyla obscurior TaxID=286306 RepID=A0AAW2FW70_9HYME